MTEQSEKPRINLSETDQFKLTTSWIEMRLKLGSLISDVERVLNTSRPASRTSAQALVTKESLLRLEKRLEEARILCDKKL